MPTRRFIARTPLAAPATEVHDWHLRAGSFERLNPAWDRLELVEGPPAGADGRIVLRVRIGPARARWVAERRVLPAERELRHVQRRGPFAGWAHVQRAIDAGAEGSVLEDEIELALPGAALGDRLGRSTAGRRLRRLFAWRHAVTAADLGRHRSGPQRSLTVAVSGASGLVGAALTAFLRSGGHRVRRLVRGVAAGEDLVGWDPVAGRIDRGGLEGLDAVVHLAGESIASGIWTRARRQRIRDSRVQGTRLLAETLAGLRHPPPVLVSASAIGYYGDREEETLDEDSAPGRGFLAEVCRAWEQATEPARQAGIRVVRVRIGLVLAAGGGMLKPMLPLFRLGLGGRVGGGRQWASWIALDDLVGAIRHALLDAGVAGPLNAVAPAPVRNADLTRTLGRVLRRPTPLPVPALVVRRLLGQMGRELLLSGARVIPRALERSGFRFGQPEIEGALRFELGRLDDSRVATSFRFH